MKIKHLTILAGLCLLQLVTGMIDAQTWQNTAEALYLAHKPANKGERVQYDFVKDRIGFRTLAVKGREILVNGKPVFLRGISIHEENPLRGGRAYSAEDARVLLE